MQAVCLHCKVAVAEDTPLDGHARCPRCGHTLGLTESATPSSPPPPSTTSRVEAVATPTQLGRYRILAQVAVGSFATIYRGRDDELGRDVAIKALHAKLLKSEKVTQAFLAEARILASLQHPHIVPIYDIGRSDDGGYFLVTHFVEGRDLKAILKEGCLPLPDAVEVVACIAEALDYAHRHGLVHRDVKPANILIDGNGTPLLVDFGLALRRVDFGTGPTDVGTPLYMSPEQARKEGHRVDARSDIYSLGVVFYELLVGRHPFRGKSLEELQAFILQQEAVPPCTCKANLPLELERIWRKATALRAADRYPTAQQMADDLRFWQQEGIAAAVAAPGPLDPAASGLSWGGDARPPRRLVPRGLRAFRAEDADFFLYLLPGPRSRAGLPESIEFWKSRIESTDADQAFRVGLLYGPSGCGKSSLIRAGLLPRLDKKVLAIHLDASPDDTEARLRKQLMKRFAPADPQAALPELLAALRRGEGIGGDEKILIVLDQFEQRLASSRDLAELRDALRQCDGVRVQALLLVRDDFWLPVSRFMHDLEVPLVEGQNIGLVDLFDALHARKVLSEFGRAFNRLSDDPAKYTPEQTTFLDQAVAGLAEGGKIIPVRLTLFAEMVKGKPWTANTFHELGGHEGVGVAFLDEALGAGAPAPRRPHRRAAMGVLQSLLPELGGIIKRRQRSRREILEASGYDRQADAFEQLMRILDQELRLVTPVLDDPGDVSSGVRAVPAYQLTHDYLVPSLRAWLRREQRQTMRGHADLRLGDAASAWDAHREKRMLPGFVEWLTIVMWSRRRFWTQPQQEMMRAANRHYAGRGVVAAILLAAFIAAGIYEKGVLDDMRSAARADQLVATIASFHSSQVTEFQREVGRLEKWTVPRLEAMIAAPETPDVDRLHARVLLLQLDPRQVAPLTEAMLRADVHEFEEVCSALAPHRKELVPRLWERFDDARAPGGERLRAACALAAYDPGSRRWDDAGGEVVKVWLREADFSLGEWMETLRPVHPKLVQPLTRLFRTELAPRDQYVVSKVLAKVGVGQPAMLAELCLEATPMQVSNLWPGVHATEKVILPQFEALLRNPGGATAELRERRQARAAAVLLRLGHGESVWPLFRFSSDPGTRSFLIHDVAACRVQPSTLIRRFGMEPDVSARRALLLALGEYELQYLPEESRSRFAESLLTLYRQDPDPGLHSATGWLLRRWGQAETLARIDLSLAHTAAPPGKGLAWSVDCEGMTMVRIPAPAEFRMGSPPDEVGREKTETQRRVRIEHPFAIATTEVTVQQFLRAQPKFQASVFFSKVPDAPILGLTWYDAVRYCRWLSEQAGIAEEQMCYPPLDQIKPGMKLPESWQTRTGYRLPTEAEWEYVCRAGTTTSRHYGTSPALLGHYGWYVHNSDGLTHPVGQLKPNDWGLFDLYGNAWEWCEDPSQPKNATVRPLRGGSFAMHPARLRSAERLPSSAEDNYPHSGFRVVRTCR